MPQQVKVEGLSQLLRTMEQLPRELVSKNGGPVRTALGRSARMIRDRARELVPNRTGTVQKNIVAARVRDPKTYGASEAYLVLVRKKRGKAKNTADDPFYWRFLEFGTARMAARPFLRPAFESMKQESLDAFKRSLTAGVQRIVKKIARPT